MFFYLGIIYIADRLYQFPLGNLSRDEKSLLHKCSKLITYMKCFIPSSCEVFSQAITTADSTYNQWLDKLHNVCQNTQESVMSFIDGQQFKMHGTNLSLVIRSKARFDTAFRLLETISKLEFPGTNVLSDVFFTPATAVHPYYSNIHQWEKKSKKK